MVFDQRTRVAIATFNIPYKDQTDKNEKKKTNRNKLIIRVDWIKIVLILLTVGAVLNPSDLQELER